ncbi:MULTISPECIES: hypothetical protein [unclassified Microcoleus]|uniref:hypothetical protein n=1 Tax=unclassified Microcoleus TaxID=2642155 RepID=UPI002FD5E93E
MPHILRAALQALKHTDNGEKLTVWERNFKPLNHLIVKFCVKWLSRQRRNREHLTFAAKLEIGVLRQEAEGKRKKEGATRRKEPEEVFLQI